MKKIIRASEKTILCRFYFLLICASLLSVGTGQAKAQGYWVPHWTPCNSVGVPLPNYVDGTPVGLSGYETGKSYNTYTGVEPWVIAAYPVSQTQYQLSQQATLSSIYNPYDLDPSSQWLFSAAGTPISTDTITAGTSARDAHIVYSDFRDFYTGTFPLGYIEGSVVERVGGNLFGYWKWDPQPSGNVAGVPKPNPPPFLSLDLNTSVSTSINAAYTYGYDYDVPPYGPPPSAWIGAALATATIPQLAQGSQTILDVTTQLPLGANGFGTGNSRLKHLGLQAPVTNHGGAYIATVSISGFANSLSANLSPDPGQSNDAGNYRYSSGASISGSSSVCIGGLTGAFINRDDPTNQTFQPFGGLVYGGSEQSTSDELSLSAADVPGASYLWLASGPGSGAYAPPPTTSAIWNLGPIHAVPGLLSFECQVNRPDGTSVKKCLNAQVGIRTDDVIMVGWIDQNGVPNPQLPAQSNGVHSQILADLPPNGGSFVNGGLPNPTGTLRIAQLAANNDHYDFDFTNPATIMTAADRNYVLDWTFYYAPNPNPAKSIPVDFRHAPTSQVPYPYMDYSVYTNFTGVNNFIKGQKTNYKLVNHFQIKYLTDGIQFLSSPTILHNDTLIGDTVNPTGLPPNFPLSVSAIYALFGLAPAVGTAAYNYLINPQSGPENGLMGVDALHTQIAQINDGSPDIFAIRAFNTLEALDVPSPVFWEDIGSQIRFLCPNTKPLVPLVQVYPTYNEYINGVDLKAPFVQAKSPTGNFNPAPYPFGTVTSIGLIPPIPGISPGTPSIPGGRNGIAGLPPGSTVRNPPPPYTVLP